MNEQSDPELPPVHHQPMPGDDDYVPAPIDDPHADPADAGELVDPTAPGALPVPPGRRRLPTAILVLGGGVLLAALVVLFFFIRFQLNTSLGDVEPDPTPTLTPRAGPPAPLQHGAVGQRMTVEGLYGKGTVMLVSAQWSDRGDLPPAAGKQYLNLELRYDCTEGTMLTSPNFYAVYDKAKTEYLPGIGAGKDPLGENELKAGQSRQGWVSFEMPPGPALLSISDEDINPLIITELPGP